MYAPYFQSFWFESSVLPADKFRHNCTYHSVCISSVKILFSEEKNPNIFAWPENVWITLYIALFLKRLLKSKNGHGHTCSPLMQDVFSFIYDLGLKMKASYEFLKRESLHKTIIFSPNMYAYLMTYSCADYIPWWLIHCLLGNAFFSCNW